MGCIFFRFWHSCCFNIITNLRMFIHSKDAALTRVSRSITPQHEECAPGTFQHGDNGAKEGTEGKYFLCVLPNSVISVLKVHRGLCSAAIHLPVPFQTNP